MGDGKTVISIGTFDGVHLGHAALVERAVVLAGTAHHPCRVVALCFDPHPMTKLRPEAAPARLTTFEARNRELLRLGASEVVRLEPTDALLGLSAREFAAKIAQEYSP